VKDQRTQKRLDSLDIKILEALGIYGPRNISDIARELNMPQQTINLRIKHLKSHFSLQLRVSIYHTFIGLKKAFVFARATPGHGGLLWESMQADGYWLYLTARYDAPESCYGIYGIPIGHTDEFQQFVKKIKELGIAQRIDLYWSTCIETVNLSDNWYNHQSEGWVFEWSKWIEDIERQETLLPKTLIETANYPQEADEIDIIILKELQKNADCKLNSIARLLNLSPQKVEYHFQNHVISKDLIEGYMVLVPHFESISDIYCFRFMFNDENNLAKFARSLKNKPFVRGISKIFGENTLLVNVYLPRKEFTGLTDSLSELIRNGLVKSYDYAIEDTSRRKGQTISFEFFKDRKWVYDHEQHMKKLLEIATTTNEDPK